MRKVITLVATVLLIVSTTACETPQDKQGGNPAQIHHSQQEN